MREMDEIQTYFAASVIVCGHVPGSDRAFVLSSCSPIWDWHGDSGVRRGGWVWGGGKHPEREQRLGSTNK